MLPERSPSSDCNELAEMSTRLRSLERTNRIFGALLIAGLAGIVLIGAAPDAPEVLPELRTRKLVITDAKGTERIRMSAETATILEMNWSSGKTAYRAQVGQTVPNCVHYIYEPSGQNRLKFGMDDKYVFFLASNRKKEEQKLVLRR
jgi:hypothetical protein